MNPLPGDPNLPPGCSSYDIEGPRRNDNDPDVDANDIEETEPCPNCDGTGYYNKSICRYCNGDQEISKL